MPTRNRYGDNIKRSRVAYPIIARLVTLQRPLVGQWCPTLNRAGELPVLQYAQALALFDTDVDLVVPGQTAGYTGASAIIGLDGTVVREASS